MRAVGVILLIVGMLLLLVGATMDVTVATSAGERVYNIGLMNERSNLLTFGGGAFLVGILMATLAGRRASTVSGKPKRDTRPCPYCAEPILNEAIKCKHCGSSVEPVEPVPLPYGWAVRIPYMGEAELNAMRKVATAAGMPVLDASDRNMTVGCFEARRDAKAAMDYLAIKHGLHGELDFIRIR